MRDTGDVALRPCPFCGGKAHWAGPSHEPYIACNSCQARTRAQNDAWEAGGNWNRRADLGALESALRLALEYWAHRQKRYKNRHPRWVQEARAALAEPKAAAVAADPT